MSLRILAAFVLGTTLVGAGCSAPTSIVIDRSRCVQTSCHGPSFACGSPESIKDRVCTLELRPADACEKFVTCGMQGGQCLLAKTDRLDRCLECVERCSDSPDTFSCAEECAK